MQKQVLKLWAYRHSNVRGWDWVYEKPSCGIESLDLEAASAGEPEVRFAVSVTKPTKDPFS